VNVFAPVLLLTFAVLLAGLVVLGAAAVLPLYSMFFSKLLLIYQQ
jgi:hypothetical protein